MLKRVGVIDYGAGNTESVLRALRAIGEDPVVIDQQCRNKCRDMTHLIFPGVGRAKQAKLQIASSGLEDEILRHVEAQKWLLGICVGMQLLGRFSEEDETQGLGLLDFKLSHFRKLGIQGPVPHMGWNTLRLKGSHPLSERFSGPDHSDQAYYFVHSFAAGLGDCEPSQILGVTALEDTEFVSMVGRGRVIGTQFHVEKSGQAGLRVLSGFLERNASCS